MTSRTRKTLLALIVAAIVGALVFVSYKPHPIPVDLAQATRGPMLVTINADGKTRVRDLYEVSAPISGTAMRSPVMEGDVVIAGQTVVAKVEPIVPSLLDSRTRGQLEAAVQEAEAAARLADAQLVQADEEHAYARREVERTQALVERGVASQTALESVQQVLKLRLAALQAASSNVDMSRSSLARAQAGLFEPDGSEGANAIELFAPASGTVLDVAQVSEHTVAVGSPLLTIGAVDELEIEVDLLSADSVGLEIGARAIVGRWGGSNDLDARLISMSPRAVTQVSSLGIEEQRVSAVFELTSPIDARAGLGHQFSVFLRVVTWEEDDVLRVPLSALFKDEGDWAVFVFEDGLAKRVAIQTGARSEEEVEVLSGIEEGAQVITHPSSDIEDGIAVIDRESL